MIKVFVVDDHSLFRLGIKVLLSNKANKIEMIGEAESGNDLFEQLSKLKILPDILLLDLIMPNMSGLDIVLKIKKRYPTIKILVLSSESDTSVIYTLVQAGIEGFVSKSSPQGNLIGAINTLAEDATYFGCDIATIIHSVSIAKKTAENLTLREIEIIGLAAKGYTAKKISEELKISLRTVETHKNNIFQKMGFKHLADLIKFAFQSGIISM